MDATASRFTLFAAIAVLAMLIPLGCREQNAVSTSAHAPIVRVELIQSTAGVLVRASGNPLVKSSGESSPQRLRFPNAPVLVSLAPDGWHIGTLILPGGELMMQAEQDGGISIAGKAYRGRYR